MRAAAIAEQAAARGLDGICLTEHNALWSDEEARALSERSGVRVLPGMELGTDVGHVLVFGLPRFTPELLAIESLLPIVAAEGAAMALAHPMRPFSGRLPGWTQMSEWFHALEAINGDHADGDESLPEGMALSYDGLVLR